MEKKALTFVGGKEENLKGKKEGGPPGKRLMLEEKNCKPDGTWASKGERKRACYCPNSSMKRGINEKKEKKGGLCGAG